MFKEYIKKKLSLLNSFIPVFPRDRIIKLSDGKKTLINNELMTSNYYPCFLQDKEEKFLLYCKNEFKNFKYSNQELILYNLLKNTKKSFLIDNIDYNEILGLGSFNLKNTLFINIFTESKVYFINFKKKTIVNSINIDKSISMMNFYIEKDKLFSVYTKKGRNKVFLNQIIDFNEMDKKEKIIFSQSDKLELFYPNIYKNNSDEYLLIVGCSKGHVFKSEIIELKSNNLKNFKFNKKMTSYKNIFYEGIESAYPSYDTKNNILYYVGFGGLHLLWFWTYYKYRKKRLKDKV